MIWLKIIERKQLCLKARMISIAEECNQLIAILVKSIQTARKKEET